MLNIEWKPIKGYEGLYEVSNDGRVRRLRFTNGSYDFEKVRECKQALNTWGYMTVSLSKNGKGNTKRVHRLVANAFLGESNLQIDHIDGNKQNNRLDNLEYVTPKENTNRAWSKGLAKNSEYQRKIARATMLERWKNNNHRKCNGIKRTKEEKREYHRNYYKKHKQFEQMAYKVEGVNS